METENQIENLEYLEHLRSKAIIATFRLFGAKRDLFFYKQKIREFLSLFVPNTVASKLSDSFKIDDLNIEFSVYGSSDFDKWDELHTILSDKYWVAYQFWEIFIKFIEFDARISVALMYCFDLIPNIESKNDLERKLSVSTGFVETYSSIGLDHFIDYIKMHGFNMLNHYSYNKLRNFLLSLEDLSSFDFYRFSDGRLVPYDSRSYKLAKFINHKVRLSITILSDTQKKILEIFTRNRKVDGTFTTPEKIGEELGYAEPDVNYHLNQILEKLTSNNIYIVNQDGDYVQIEPNSYHEQLILLSREIDDLKNHPTIPTDHRALIDFLVTPNFTNAYPSVHLAMEVFRFDSIHSVRSILKNTVRRIKNQNDNIEIYYFKDGRKIPDDTNKHKLIKSRDNPTFRGKLTLEQRKVLDLITTLDGSRLRYDSSDILNELGITSSNAERYIVEYTKLLVDKLEGEHSELIFDERGIKIEKNQLELIKLVFKYGLKIAKALPPTDQEIIKQVCKRNSDDTFPSCLFLAKQRGVSYEGMQNAISRCYKRYKALIEA